MKQPHVGNTWERYSQEVSGLANWYDFSTADVHASRQATQAYLGGLDIGSVTWFIPDFDHPYYGGIHTILRFAQFLQERKGVATQFAVTGRMAETRAAELMGQAFPGLSRAAVHRVDSWRDLDTLEPTDASIATLWTTAYYLLRFNKTKRKFYFLQDYEPLFYPAGSAYALAESTYRFGFFGIANTPAISAIYEGQYSCPAEFFVPCVDTDVFKPAVKQSTNPSDGRTVFFYGRPEHPRNGFELGAAALARLKERLGSRVHIVSAGAAWRPRDLGLGGIIDNLGLLSYQQAAALYRQSTAGLVMMFTRHPSYLPIELMASGCLVVSNHNPATTWLLRHRENALLSDVSATCLADTLHEAILDARQRERIVASAAEEVRTRYGDWDAQMEKIHAFMSDPLAKRHARGGPRGRPA